MRIYRAGRTYRKYSRFTTYIVMISCAISVVTTNIAYASGIDALVKYAAPSGAMSNVNAPAIIKDQAGGYMTGGSILLRGPKPKELSPFMVQTPRLKFDACTGSGDFRFGAMSYISGAEFSNFLKSVAHASGAYLVKMSIKTACPQCEDIMSYLETVARDVNGLTMNQCSLAQSIAEGTFSKLTSSEKQRCMMDANSTGSSRDMFDTTRKCQDSAGERVHSLGPEFESLLGDEFNLVWKALSKGAGSDTNFKELMMSVSGTVIGKKEEGRYKFTYKPSLLQDKELLEKFIGVSGTGTSIKLYACDSTDLCLDPVERDEALREEDTLYGNVSKILRSLVTKVQADNPRLSDEEEALLGFSSIPILHLIEMELSSKANTDDLLVRVGEFIEVVCFDVITNYMQVMLSRVISSVQALEHAQTDDTIIRNFITDAENTRKYLSDAKFNAFQKLQVITQVKQRLEQQSKEFEFRFSNIMKNLGE